MICDSLKPLAIEKFSSVAKGLLFQCLNKDGHKYENCYVMKYDDLKSYYVKSRASMPVTEIVFKKRW